MDDSEMWLETISTLLGSEYDVTVTADPDEALALAQQHDFSLAIIDQRLGEARSGIELLMQLRRIRPSLRTVILTGFPTVDDAAESMSAGAVDYLSKAAGNIAAELRARVERAVSQAESALVPHLRAKLDAQLRADVDYLPERYIAPRMSIGSEDHAEYTVDDGVSTMRGWLGAEGPSFIVLLGDPGSGKTFFLHALARQLMAQEGGPLPVIIPLRALDRPRTLDALLTRHFADLGVERMDVRATRELLERGHLALLLDGWDELLFGGTREDADAFLSMIVRGAIGSAKVVVTSREHVPALTQLRTLRERSHRMPGLRTCTLLPFTADQVREFWARKLYTGAPSNWPDVLTSAPGLTSLATNPRLLEVIATLDAQNLLDTVTEGRPAERVASLYRAVLSRWLDLGQGGSSSDIDQKLPRETLWAVLTAIANRLWRTSEISLSEADLLEEISVVMQSLRITGTDPHALAHHISMQAVLRLDRRGYYSFTHRSIQEWLVANGAADEMRQGLAPDILVAAPLSEPMYDFLVALAGEGSSTAWARHIITDPERFGTHATALARRLLETFPRILGHEMNWKPAFPWLEWLNGVGDESIISRLAPEIFRSAHLQIRTLRIRNIRAFTDTGAISFCDAVGAPRPTTLLLGDNAAGKSTILQCLTIAFLGPALASQLGIVPERFLRHKARSGVIEVELAFDDDTATSAPHDSFFVGIELRAGEVSFRAADRGDCTLLTANNINVENAAPRLDAIRRLDHGAFGFLCAYGPWRNLNVEPNTSLTQQPNSVLDRVYSLFHSETLVMDPDLLTRILAGDSVHLRSAPIGVSADNGQALLDAIRAIAPEISLADEGPLALHGVPLAPRSLSDGYGSLVALVAHIFRHSVALSDPRSLKGIILIDEIDLHLHPSWQRRIAFDLIRAFPNAQLIYTSHSPMVAGATMAGSIVLLRREGERIGIQCDIDSVQGWRADQILTSVLFDLESSRDIETSRLIQRYTQLVVATTLSAPEAEELRDLGAQLRIRLPTAEETAQARRAFELIEATCTAELASISLTEREHLVTELQAQLLESLTQSRRPS